MEPPTPHDSLFKSTFSHPEHAAGELQHLLPNAIVARIDWSTLRLYPGSFVDESLRSRHSDLLFSARCGEGKREIFLYLLLEHQSTSDSLMPYRLLVYMVRFWEQHLRARRGATRLPAIVPLVVHHATDGWRAPLSFPELLDLDPESLEAIAAYVPSFSYLLDDLPAASDASLRARAMSALGRLTLFCLRYAPEPDEIVRRLAGWLDLLHQIRTAPGGAEAMELFWRYIFTVSEPPRPEALVERLVLVVGQKSKEEIVTAADQLMQRGIVKGQQELLLDLLRARFGALPEAVIARIRDADPEKLKRWALQVITAPSLTEVLTEG